MPIDDHSFEDQLHAWQERLGSGRSFSWDELMALNRLLAHASTAVRQNSTLVECLDELEERLWSLENSRFIRLVRWPGRLALNWKSRLGQVLLHSPVHPLYLRLQRSRKPDRAYQAWVENEQRALPSRQWFEERIHEFVRRPVCSILMPVHNPPREWLEKAIDSVRGQFYPDWQLCICDDASEAPWMARYLEEAARDPRICCVRSATRLGIAGALNQAAELANGDYTGFLDHDDVLAPEALFYVIAALQHSDVDFIYSDEDRLDEAGRRVEPIFKPAWSPDLLTTCMYLGHFWMVNSCRFAETGGFRREMDGSQDHDLALRLSDGAVEVRHIPRVLYHWRKHRTSTAASASAKPFAQAAGRRALVDALRRRGIDASVEDGKYPSTYRVRRSSAKAGKASVVICSRRKELAARCLRALERKTEYRDYEVLLIQHNVKMGLEHLRCRTISYEGEFNFARMNNLGACEAQGDWLVFLNDDVTPLRSTWLEELARQAARPEVGVVGARLLYRSGAIQHAGTVTSMIGGVGHPGRHTFGSPYWSWLGLTRNVSAVTGACLAIRHGVFEDLGGWDERFPVNFNDIDLCLRARAAGYEVILEASAMLRHDECQTRPGGVRWRERQMWRDKWPRLAVGGDPYYSPHLSIEREDASLRMNEPWTAEDNSR